MDKLELDFQVFCQVQKMRLPCLEHVNRNPDKPDRPGFSTSVLKEMQSINALDYELYNYAQSLHRR